MKTILKVFLVLVAICFIIGIGFTILVGSAFGTFDKDYSINDLKENFNLKQTEIYELKTFINSVVPKDKSVDIEFDNNDKLGIFHVNIDGNYDSNWDVEINSGKVDTLLQKLGWTTETLKILKDKLDKANCISIASGDPFQIGFKRSGMGKYYFRLLDKPMNDSIKSTLDQNCIYIHNDSVIFEYGGGAIGEDCLYNR
jgi:hypothetical protein